MNTKLEIFKSAFEESKEKKKGISFYVNGNTIIGYVIDFNENVVEARNQKSSRVLIATEQIDAIELS